MEPDRITQLSIEGMRCIESITLDLRAFTVLIGENGAGKSTILEALELLRKAATERSLTSSIYDRHGGAQLVRGGATKLNLAARIEGNGPALTYRIQIRHDQPYLSISQESLTEEGGGTILERAGYNYVATSTGGSGSEQVPKQTVGTDEPALGHSRVFPIPQLTRTVRALTSIEVHPPLDLRRTWASSQGMSTARSSNVVRPADRLEPGGANLVNIYAALRNQRNWRETLGRLQVSLGDIEDMLFLSEPSGGTQTLGLRWRSGPDTFLSGLSDGQISMLALIAIQQLQRPSPPSIIAIDEPEEHLHPGLVARVALGLQELSERSPILVGTQSDTFLNAVEHPEDAAVLCQLDDERRTVLHRPDADRLRDWLGEFKGLGAVRGEGLQGVVFRAS